LRQAKSVIISAEDPKVVILLLEKCVLLQDSPLSTYTNFFQTYFYIVSASYKHDAAPNEKMRKWHVEILQNRVILFYKIPLRILRHICESIHLSESLTFQLKNFSEILYRTHLSIKATAK
jgi:hypothetical protein